MIHKHRQNTYRIKQLEREIPIWQSNLEQSVCIETRQHARLKLSELKLEYQERTGRQYDERGKR